MPSDNDTWLLVDIREQTLCLFRGDRLLAKWLVSTALNGPGERLDSGCTPCGEHQVRIKIGVGCPANTVFVGRRPTGEIYSETLGVAQPERDWILSRVIWLTGAQSGRNRGGDCDSLRRYIYIHGCPDFLPMGIPLSHGCIRMRNADVVDLFERVEAGTRVVITEGHDAH